MTCADLLFSRRFDHITDIFADGDERTTPTLPPAIFRGTEDSVAFGTACDNADSSLKRIADQSHFRRDGDCIVSRKVSKPGDDVIVLVTEHRFAPGENGLFDVRHLYVGVQKGTRLSPAYEWSLTTDVSYFKAPLMFLIMASSDGLEFPTILESSPQNLAGDTELRAYVQNLQFLRP